VYARSLVSWTLFALEIVVVEPLELIHTDARYPDIMIGHEPRQFFAIDQDDL
jgi:hypothetical protein